MSSTTNEPSNGANASHPYSIPLETKKLLDSGILNNPLITPSLPKGIHSAAQLVSFTGTDSPSIPINWRFAESISALKALEASMLNVLLQRKYNLPPQKAVINTDHAQLFIMSIITYTLDPSGLAINAGLGASSSARSAYETYFTNADLHHMAGDAYRAGATNIYRCADGRYFHLHGSMNCEPTQDSVGVPHFASSAPASAEEVWGVYAEKLARIGSAEMQRRASEEFGQAGTVCWTREEYRCSEHGRANAHVGLWETHAVPNATQAPCWWPAVPETSPRRPLAGLKVVDLTRVIAAPAVTRGLAELGASVMRVTAAHITDMSTLHVDLNWGKWNAHLDFRQEADRERLRELVREADVVVQGYRPGVLDKYGFSVDGLLELTRDRERGLVVVRENCYGWHGPWAYRSGWQQISDANTGVSMEFGRAMGNDEPVTPVFPNSDFCTGVAGVVGVLDALMRRAEEGGSWKVDIALNYYSQWLVNSVGTYPQAVWDDVWSRNGRQVFRHYHNMPYTLPRFVQMLKQNSGPVIFNPAFFEDRHSAAIGTDVRTPKPIINFPEGPVQLKYNVGTRGNGVDQAKWPENLMTEAVA
ncbi:CoA-transferase family III [Polyplosphaeria fusca]|uniref:CoA-transferase family III n=1 Tax=Polyplosphaeria fusca TaxID=682080 RepID=A0A9P4QKK0_9PLEO|nr:CoA-transferase family III [Polyplosphaeria fusca]